MLLTGAAAAALALTHRRWDPERLTTAMLATALLGFFAAWSGVVGSASAAPWAGVVLFVAVIGLFRLMGRFERPRRG
jgi:hypothetical protein